MKVEFVRENNKIVGYVILVVNIVIFGVIVFGGVMFMFIGIFIGIFVGVIFVIDGMNGILKEFINFKRDSNVKLEGIVVD